MGVTHMVSAGHYLASAAGYRILEEGGNAIDAGVASGIAMDQESGVLKAGADPRRDAYAVGR